MTIPNDKVSLRKIFSLQGDKTLWAIFFILMAISLIEVYSAASTLTYNHTIFGPIINHAINLLIGVIFAWVFHNIPCRWFKFWLPAWVFFVALLVFLAMFGEKVNDGARWIPIFGIRFQPSEFAKGALVVIVAFLLAAYQTKKGADKHAFKLILIFTLITCGLIFIENYSTAILLFFVIILMMVFGRVPWQQIGKLILSLLIGVVAVYCLVKAIGTETLSNEVGILHRFDNFVSRIDRFLGTEKDSLSADSTKQTRPKDYFNLKEQPQEGHAYIAIAKSHIIGCGPGNSRERDFLPQAYSDFIFAIIIEELGLLGGAAVVLLYIMLLFRACKIANRCERSFPAFLTLGLALLIVVQAAINMCVAVGIVPVTGLPLPLVSRGGSSIMVTSIYFGMMISVSRFAKRRETTAASEAAQPRSNAAVNEAEFHNDEGMN